MKNDKKILMIDNYDSFTYNIVHIVKKLGYQIDVFRNDKISVEEVGRYDKIILSPGPGIPSEAGILQEVVKAYGATKDIFGVCLGHQCIGEIYGGTLVNLDKVYHGIETPVTLTTSKDLLFDGLPEKFQVGRYHSWVVGRENFPLDILEVTAEDENGQVMALKHKTYKLRGVQFHPESILTPEGEKILQNWLES